MATITLTIPDNKIVRIRTAFGHGGLSPSDPWVPATQAEIAAWLNEQIRLRIVAFETALAEATARRQVEADVGTW